jgi:hypothetical protein
VYHHAVVELEAGELALEGMAGARGIAGQQEEADIAPVAGKKGKGSEQNVDALPRLESTEIAKPAPVEQFGDGARVGGSSGESFAGGVGNDFDFVRGDTEVDEGAPGNGGDTEDAVRVAEAAALDIAELSHERRLGGDSGVGVS